MRREPCIVGKAQMKTSWKPLTQIQLQAASGALWGRGAEPESPRRPEAAPSADFSKRYKSESEHRLARPAATPAAAQRGGGATPSPEEEETTDQLFSVWFHVFWLELQSSGDKTKSFHVFKEKKDKM